MTAYKSRVILALSLALWALLAVTYSCAAKAEAGPVVAPMVAPIVYDMPEVVIEGGVVAPAFVVEPSPTPSAPPARDAQSLVMIATLVAAVLRVAIFALRSPVFGAVWSKAPMHTRLAALAVLTGAAALADQLATGVPFGTALMTAIGGLMAAVSTHEMQQRVIKKGGAA